MGEKGAAEKQATRKETLIVLKTTYQSPFCVQNLLKQNLDWRFFKVRFQANSFGMDYTNMKPFSIAPFDSND